MRNYRTPYIIWWAIFLHIAWGVSLILKPAAGQAAVLVGIDRFLVLGMPTTGLGLILILAASLAAYSLVNTKSMSNNKALVLLMPQYFLLVAALLSDIEFIVRAKTSAGVHIDRIILTVVLAPVLIAAVLHSLAIAERHLWQQR